jgi:hypothetical protein
MLLELLRILREPRRYIATFRSGEIYIEEIEREALRPAPLASDHITFPGQ